MRPASGGVTDREGVDVSEDSRSRRRTPNIGACAVEGCGQPMRKRVWCASHYAQWHKTGEAPKPFKYKWGQPGPRFPKVVSPQGVVQPRKKPKLRKTKPQLCVVCGSTTRVIRSYRFCSTGCKSLYYRHNGTVPDVVACAQCGCTIDLTVQHASGRRKRSTLALCEKCVPWTWRCAGVTVADLAKRDGTGCSICGEPVDMTLGRNDGRACPSIDHVIPRSRGGTDAPLNLALAHLSCNCRKSDRMPIAI